MITQARIVKENATNAEYMAGPGMNRSALKVFAQCPFKFHKGVPAKESPSLSWGTLVDALLLDTGDFDHRFVLRPETYPDSKTGEPKPWSNNANFCKAWNEAHGHLEIITADWLAEAKKAAEILRADNRIAKLIDGAKVQVWIEGLFNDSIPVKTLIDLVPVGDYSEAVADLKTAKDASPDKWARECYNWWYHVQAAMNLDILNAATGEKRNAFLHVIQESEPPYAIGRRMMSEDFIQEGRKTYEAALNRLAWCRKNETWPGYDDTADSIDGWTLTQPEAWMILHGAVTPTDVQRKERPEEISDGELLGFEEDDA